MQFKTVAAALFVAVAAADTISDLVAQMPTCATSCFSTADAAIGCAVTDFSCQCSKVDALTESISPCLLKACSIADVATVSKLSPQICAAVSAAGTSSTTAVSSAAASAATTATRASNATVVSPTASITSASSTPTAAAGRIEAAGMGIVAIALAAMAL